MVLFKINLSLFIHREGIVMLAPSHRRRRKARTDLKTFDGIDAKHRFSKISVQLIKDGFTESRR